MERYSEYCLREEAISFEEAMAAYEQMAGLLRPGDEDDEELFADYLESAVSYAGVRSGWLLKTREEKMEADPGRTAAHNLSIIRLNTLARWFERTGRDASWRDVLGDGSWRNADYDAAAERHRKRIGDFNCYVALVYGLNAR